jgi:prepilin-type N-terminal cleavage/methylation domain-containing protein
MTGRSTGALPAGRLGRGERGFTLFELIIVVILVALLAGILLGRFLTYQEAAEKTAMEQTAGAIQSALTIQVAGLIARGSVADIPKLASVNPVNFLAQKPKNYAGEYYEPAPGDIPEESWYYDLQRKQLVYLVRRGEHFAPDSSGNKRVRYKTVVVYNEGFPFQSVKARKKDVGGVILTEVEPYKWELK